MRLCPKCGNDYVVEYKGNVYCECGWSGEIDNRLRVLLDEATTEALEEIIQGKEV